MKMHGPKNEILSAFLQTAVMCKVCMKFNTDLINIYNFYSK